MMRIQSEIHFVYYLFVDLIKMQAITGDSVLLKFEKAKSSLGESLKRVEDIVPQSIGCQVINFIMVI